MLLPFIASTFASILTMHKLPLEWNGVGLSRRVRMQEYEHGGKVVYGKRERPHLIFDPTTGDPSHLCTGVCLNSNYSLCNDNPWPGYFDYTFTSVQPILAANTSTSRNDGS